MENHKLLIDTDLEVKIDHIDQWITYAGMLEGLPTDRWNAQIIDRTKKKAKERFLSDAIYMIEPKQTPIYIDRKYPFGTPMELPSVTCMIDVSIPEVFRDQEKDGSSLIIIWFQNHYAFPIEDEILQKIKEIPFSKLCEEFDY